MKFACEKCNTKYSIADERVKGRVLKIRCKTCSNVITVTEQSGGGEVLAPLSQGVESAPTMLAASLNPAIAPAEPAPGIDRLIDDAFGGGVGDLGGGTQPAKPLTLDVSQSQEAESVAEWYISTDGLQEGPFTVEKGRELVAKGRRVGKDVFVWKGGFGDWLSAATVPEFKAAATTSPTARPKATPAPAAKAAAREPSLAPVRDLSPAREPSLVPARELGNPSRENSAAKPKPRAPTGLDLAPALGLELDAPASRPGVPKKRTPPPPTPELDEPVRPAGTSETERALSASEPLFPSDPSIPLGVDIGGPNAGGELRITEASQVVNLALLKQQAAAARARQAAAPNSAASSAAAAARKESESAMSVAHSPNAPTHSEHRTVKVLAILGGVSTLALLVVLFFVLSNRSQSQSTVMLDGRGAAEVKIIRDEPVNVADSGANKVAKNTAPVAGGKGGKGGKAVKVAQPGKPPVAGTAAAGSKNDLTALYGDDSSQRNIATPQKSVEHAQESNADQQQSINNVIISNKKSLQRCYDAALKQGASAPRKARIVPHVKIGVSGAVTSVSIVESTAGAELDSCIVGMIKKWHFSASGSEFQTEFPLLLQAAQ